MRTFIVPALAGETHQEFCYRVSNLAWQFAEERALTVNEGRVTLEGDKPLGSSFEEVLDHVG